jgi:hypothetical protein
LCHTDAPLQNTHKELTLGKVSSVRVFIQRVDKSRIVAS